MDSAWPWIFFGIGMWFLFGPNRWGARRCGSKRSKRERTAQEHADVARLKEALADSHAQIDALKARLEAVETIVTDEERILRREFSALDEARA
ncbi:MAG: hypothetical protein AAGJ32_04500 [Pseudomonadota bacterium]